jgi:hypothetical protein
VYTLLSGRHRRSREPNGSSATPHRARELGLGAVPRVCTAPGCGRKPPANGLCAAHDHRCRRGKPRDTPLRQYRVTGCSVEGCSRPHTARDYCHLLVLLLGNRFGRHPEKSVETRGGTSTTQIR